MLLPTLNSIPPSPHPRPQLTHTHTHTHTHARTHARTHTHTHTHTRTHARTHARTHTRTHTDTHEYETGSGWHVQISPKAWRKRCVFRLALKAGREGEGYEYNISCAWIHAWVSACMSDALVWVCPCWFYFYNYIKDLLLYVPSAHKVRHIQKYPFFLFFSSVSTSVILPWLLLMSVPLSLYVISTDFPWQGKWRTPVCCSSLRHAGSSLSASPSLLLLWQFSFVFGDNKRENKYNCMAGPPLHRPIPQLFFDFCLSRNRLDTAWWYNRQWSNQNPCYVKQT